MEQPPQEAEPITDDPVEFFHYGMNSPVTTVPLPPSVSAREPKKRGMMRTRNARIALVWVVALSLVGATLSVFSIRVDGWEGLVTLGIIVGAVLGGIFGFIAAALFLIWVCDQTAKWVNRGETK